MQNHFKKACISDSVYYSNVLKIEMVIPSVSITADELKICKGDTIQFKANFQNGGKNPKFFWSKNNVLLSNQSDSVLIALNSENGDEYTCNMRSALGCQYSYNLVSSDTLKAEVNHAEPGIQVKANQWKICEGDTVVFQASVIDEGDSPEYIWKKNGSILSVNNVDQINLTGFTNGDSVNCVLVSNELCANPKSVVSSAIRLEVLPVLRAEVSMETLSGSAIVCAGDSVQLKAIAINGGDLPVFNWLVNGIDVGLDGNIEIFKNLKDKDSIECVLSSSLQCIENKQVKSKGFVLSVSEIMHPAISITGREIINGNAEWLTVKSKFSGTELLPDFQWQDSTHLHSWQDIDRETDSGISYLAEVGNRIRCAMSSNDRCVEKKDAFSNVLNFVRNSSIGMERLSELKVFPNATDGELQIQSESDSQKDIMVLSSDGKELMHFTSEGTRIDLDLGELSNGNYYLRVIENGRVYHAKIAVIH